MGQEWGVLTCTLAATILGFLIAGFAIFATMSRHSFFVELAQFRVESRPISQFKFVFFNFIFIFIHYVSYIATTLLVAMLWVGHSPVWFAAEYFHRIRPRLTDLLSAELDAAIAIYTIYILLVLRGFIWNLYQALLIVIFEAEHSEN
jgi:hypothetical protein